MLPSPPRSRLSGSPYRTVLIATAAALIGTAVGGVSILGVVVAVTAPSNHDSHTARRGDVGAAPSPKPVIVASPQQPQGGGRAPTDQAAAPSGPVGTAGQSADARHSRPEPSSPDPTPASTTGSQTGEQSPAAAPAQVASDQQASASASANRRDFRHAYSSRSKRLAGTHNGSTRAGTGPTNNSANNNWMSDAQAAQRRDPSARPLYDSFHDRWRDERDAGQRYRGDRDYRYRDDAGPPPRGVIIIPNRGFDSPASSRGWGGFFGGGGWGGNGD